MDKKFTSHPKAEKYSGNEKKEDRIRLFYSPLTKAYTHMASVNAEELTLTQYRDT